MAYAVDEARIREAEGHLGRALPGQLRARLLRDNGGSARCDGAEWQLFPVWDPTDRRTARKTANHLVVETGVARAWPRFPAGAIAIASDGSGDLLIVRPHSDAIEIWLHETGEIVPAPDLDL